MRASVAGSVIQASYLAPSTPSATACLRNLIGGVSSFRPGRLVGEKPIVQIPKELRSLLAGTIARLGGGQCIRMEIQREVAENRQNLAGSNVGFIQKRARLYNMTGAVRSLEVRVFDQLHRAPSGRRGRSCHRRPHRRGGPACRQAPAALRVGQARVVAGSWRGRSGQALAPQWHWASAGAAGAQATPTSATTRSATAKASSLSPARERSWFIDLSLW